MALPAASSAIETAPFSVLAGVAAIGAVIVLYRVAILHWCQTAMGTGVGTLAGGAFIVIGGYGWLLFGLIGILLWVFDQL